MKKVWIFCLALVMVFTTQPVPLLAANFDDDALEELLDPEQESSDSTFDDGEIDHFFNENDESCDQTLEDDQKSKFISRYNRMVMYINDNLDAELNEISENDFKISDNSESEYYTPTDDILILVTKSDNLDAITIATYDKDTIGSERFLYEAVSTLYAYDTSFKGGTSAAFLDVLDFIQEIVTEPGMQETNGIFYNTVEDDNYAGLMGVTFK